MSDSVRSQRQQPTKLPFPWDSPGKNTGVGCHFLLQCMKVKSKSEVAQSCPTPSDPMDCSLLGSSVHGIFQARVLEWVAIAFSDNGILLSYKKEQNCVICKDVDEPRDCHTNKMSWWLHRSQPGSGNSLVVQWLGLCASTLQVPGSIPG